MKRFLLLFSTLLIASSLALTACGGGEEEAPTPEAEPEATESPAE
ncbi:hypothetical protein [Spirulina subsalsa]|nr:hypothetical protein [Spirulina subsalsa]